MSWAPGCPAAIATVLADRTMRDIARRTHLRFTEVVISLVAGVREYALADVLHVSEAYYEASSDASTWVKLEDTSLNAIVIKEDGWRTGGTRDDPRRVYVSSTDDAGSSKAVMGLDPVPATSTVSGYPRVRVYCTKHAALSGSDTLPSDLLTEDVVLSGMRHLWSVRTDPPTAAYWKEVYDGHIDALILHTESKQDNLNFEFSSPFQRMCTRVV